MAFKRLIGVLAVKEGLVVKSYGYQFWRPAGGLVSALRNLDRWQADEILVLDISGRNAPDPAVVQQIKKSRVSTPVTYGGGIRKCEHLQSLLEAGCERFVVESLLHQDPDGVRKMADMVGTQALIGSLPLVREDSGLQVCPRYAQRWNNGRCDCSLPALSRRYASAPVAEVLIIDMLHEGWHNSFSLLAAPGPVEFIASLNKGIIWFGGLSASQAAQLLPLPETIAVAFGNINHERELAFGMIRCQILKQAKQHILRPVPER